MGGFLKRITYLVPYYENWEKITLQDIECLGLTQRIIIRNVIIKSKDRTGRRKKRFEWLALCIKIVLLTLLLFTFFYGCRCQNASFLY